MMSRMALSQLRQKRLGSNNLILESEPKRSTLSSASHVVCSDLFRAANAFNIRYNGISEDSGRIIWPMNELQISAFSLMFGSTAFSSFANPANLE